MSVPVRSGGNQLVVQVAANERHERSPSRMDPADRQPISELCHVRVAAREHVELQLGGGFQG